MKSYVRFTLITLAATAALYACGSKKSAIEVPPPEATTPQTPGGGQTPGGEPEEKRDATLIARMPSNINKYIDPNARLDFEFEFAGEKETGQVSFSGGVGEMTVTQLPSGKASDLKLKLFQGGEAKLEGSATNVTLNPGKNRRSLDLTPVGGGGGGGGGGGTDAELTIGGIL